MIGGPPVYLVESTTGHVVTDLPEIEASEPLQTVGDPQPARMLVSLLGMLVGSVVILVVVFSGVWYLSHSDTAE